MSTVVETLIFDTHGDYLTRIDPLWRNVTWRLNNTGTARFLLPYADAECTPVNLAIGNRILIRFDNGLPDWGGVIDVPRAQNSTGVTVNAFTADRILSWRQTAQTAEYLNDMPGTIYADLIKVASALWPTGIARGSIYAGGTWRTETYHYANIYAQIRSLAALSGQDFEIVPVYGGRLRFSANWHEQAGRDLSGEVLLVEDRNIQDGMILNEQGPIVNTLVMPGRALAGQDWTERAIGTAHDASSQTAYDRREAAEFKTTITDQDTLDASAVARIAELADPRKRFRLIAQNTDPAGFGRYAVGDIVTLHAFLKAEDWAFEGSARILGRTWTRDNVCRLEAIEWLG